VHDGLRDVDAVLTTRELARMIKEAGIDFVNLPDEEFDQPLGMSTGAAVIFGATGGVMEAALRTVSELVEGKPLDKIDFEEVRGLEGVREATVTVDGTDLKLAIVNGTGMPENSWTRSGVVKPSTTSLKSWAAPVVASQVVASPYIIPMKWLKSGN